MKKEKQYYAMRMKGLLLQTFLGVLISLTATAQTARFYADKAEREIDKKHLDQAIVYYSKAIDVSPDSSKYYYLRGSCYCAVGDEKNCAKDFDECIALNPKDITSYYNVAQFYYMIQKFPEAEDYFGQGLKVPGINDTARFQLYLNRGSARHAMLDIDGAYNDYLEAFKLDSSRTSVIINISGIYRDKGDFDRSEYWLLKADRKQPNDPIINNNLGYFYIQIGKHDKAVKYLDFVIDTYSNKTDDLDKKQTVAYAYSNRGFCHFTLGNHKKALSDFEQSIKLYPANSYVYKNRAQLYIAQKKYNEACRDLNTAVVLGYADQYGPEVDELFKKYCK